MKKTEWFDGLELIIEHIVWHSFDETISGYSLLLLLHPIHVCCCCLN